MSFRPEILEACQDYGLVLGRTLVSHAGWKTRGSEAFNPHGSVNHHTAGPRVGDLPTLNTLLYGRADLAGPLCNGALSRSAVIHLIAAGRANHAGLGGWNGLVGNSAVWGLEVEHTGTSAEPVTAEQWETMYRWHAACCDVSGVSAANVCQHFEWAPTRKIDFVKSITNPTAFRANVSTHLQGVDMDATQDKRLQHVEALLMALVPRAPQKVAMSGDGIGDLDSTGTPAADIWRWLVNMYVGDATKMHEAIAEAVVAALPPASAGGITEAQIQAACEAAVSAQLGFLKPGQ